MNVSDIRAVVGESWHPWVPAPELARGWGRRGLLRDLLEARAWVNYRDGHRAEAKRLGTRVDAVLDAMSEIAPQGYFEPRRSRGADIVHRAAQSFRAARCPRRTRQPGSVGI